MLEWYNNLINYNCKKETGYLSFDPGDTNCSGSVFGIPRLYYLSISMILFADPTPIQTMSRACSAPNDNHKHQQRDDDEGIVDSLPPDFAPVDVGVGELLCCCCLVVNVVVVVGCECCCCWFTVSETYCHIIINITIIVCVICRYDRGSYTHITFRQAPDCWIDWQSTERDDDDDGKPSAERWRHPVTAEWSYAMHKTCMSNFILFKVKLDKKI